MRVFTYNLMFNKLAALTKAASAVGASVNTITPEALHQSIEHLVEGKCLKPGKDSQIKVQELVIFEGFSSDLLDKFLDAYNSTGAPKVVFKAMVTQVNKKWSPAYLFEQLLKEQVS